MQQIKFLKSLGYIYDLLFLFYAEFNTEYCIEYFTGNLSKTESEAYINCVLDRFRKSPEDLRIFFHRLDDGSSFLRYFYVDPYKEHFKEDFGFDFLIKKLSDTDAVREKLIRFYFYGLTNEDVSECLSSNKKLFEYIKASKYSEDEKSMFYEFFIDPVPYCRLLSAELEKKEAELSEYYKDNYEVLLNLTNSLTIDILCEKLKPFDDFTYLKNDTQSIYVSFVLLNKYLVKMCYVSDGAVYLLGLEYEDALKCVKSGGDKHPMEEVCSALADKNRLKIIELLTERNEMSWKEIEKELDVKGATVYHHLSRLTRLNALKTRSVGKKVYYSINERFFANLTEMLREYS